ncbi:MAG: gamma-mobile-trio recombinase GmtY, partial [Bacillota bacterium]
MKHTKLLSKTILDNTGFYMEIPVLLIEENECVNILWPLHKYFTKNYLKSNSWRDKLIQVTGLLLDYLDANQNCFSDSKSFFESFTNSIYSGTINEEGYDPSGLYWLPKRTKTARILLQALSDFSDWLCLEYGASQLNPWRDATSFEEKLNWMAANNKSYHSFLGHLDSYLMTSETARKARTVTQRSIPTGDFGVIKSFPEDKMHDLLWIGFKKQDKSDKLNFLNKYNWRDIAITILLHGGGLRESEPFHIWVQDVMPDPYDPQLALVRVYHPVDGVAPKDFKKPTDGKFLPNREAYLRIKYGLKPRNRVAGLKHAGWKNPKMSDEQQNYMQVHWFPSEWGYLFMQVWKMYMAQRIHEKIMDNHPFLFVSFNNEHKG